LENRSTLNIKLPDSYLGSANKRYPVIFNVGDDNNFTVVASTVHWLSHNQEVPIPEIIVVSLSSKTAVGFIERGLNNADILKFFETDVIPYIDRNYRTQPFRILLGSQLFGGAPLYALVHQPALFKAYISINPWLENDSELIAQFEAFLKKEHQHSTYLWLSSGKNAQELPVFNYLNQQLDTYSQQKLNWKTQSFHGVSTMAQLLVSLPRASEYLFSDLTLDEKSSEFRKGTSSILKYYRQLSQDKYGYAVSAETAMNAFALKLLNEEKVDQAIEVFQLNVAEYPRSPHVYAGLAEALLLNKDVKAALQAQHHAYKFAKEQKNPYEAYYLQQLNSISNLISGSQLKSFIK
jgi:hypothetical protein